MTGRKIFWCGLNVSLYKNHHMGRLANKLATSSSSWSQPWCGQGYHTVQTNPKLWHLLSWKLSSKPYNGLKQVWGRQSCSTISMKSLMGKNGKTRKSLVDHRNIRCLRKGQIGEMDCRYNFFDNDDKVISPWHDVSLYSSLNVTHPKNQRHEKNIYVNFVNEIPRGERAKMEVSTNDEFNFIKQDSKNGKPRYYHFDSLVNYGCLPQTWEDPLYIDPRTSCGGDNDPVDVVEIGRRIAEIGEIYPIKVLGVLGMIDEGETDWKIIGIDAQDPLASQLNDIDDLELFQETAGTVNKVRQWFATYKIPDGKPEAHFAFEGKAMAQEFALDVIEETHQQWRKLLHSTSNTKLWTGQATATVLKHEQS